MKMKKGEKNYTKFKNEKKREKSKLNLKIKT